MQRRGPDGKPVDYNRTYVELKYRQQGNLDRQFKL